MKSGSIPAAIVHRELNGRIYFIRQEIDMYRLKFDEMQHPAT
jgi:hypothetical protein